MERTLASLCALVQGEIIGDGATVIRGVRGADEVQAGELTFAEDAKHLAAALATPASAVIVSKQIEHLGGRPGIRVDNPKFAFALLLALFNPERLPTSGIHPSVVRGHNVVLGEGVALAAHVVLGDEVVIGRGTWIGPGVAVGDRATIGADCRIDPNVVIYRDTQIGDRVLIHGGTVIGGDGFGYVLHEGRHVKVPQVGNVVIEDDVELGCNVCVDRATIGSTVIRRGTKLDNLVQIAHNDRIGQHVLMSGQVGLSGSVVVGDYAVFGGKAGVVDHVTIGPGARIGAASVVTKNVASGAAVWGYPARPLQRMKEQMAALARLPGLLRRRGLTRDTGTPPAGPAT